MSYRQKIKSGETFQQTLQRFTAEDCQAYIRDTQAVIDDSIKKHPGYHMIPVWQSGVDQAQARLLELIPNNGQTQLFT